MEQWPPVIQDPRGRSYGAGDGGEPFYVWNKTVGKEKAMVLHIGGDMIVATENIVAIIDVDTANASRDMRLFFNEIKTEYEKRNAESCKSFVITSDFRMRRRSLRGQTPERKSVIYCSNISSGTLLKRCGFVDKING